PVEARPREVHTEEQAPLPTDDTQGRGEWAILEWNHGHGRVDGHAGHGQSPGSVDRMGLCALKGHGRTFAGNEPRARSIPRVRSPGRPKPLDYERGFSRLKERDRSNGQPLIR